jgi:DnaJ-class molecular chaperone
MTAEYVRCETCLGRGYMGGGRLPTCRHCAGRGHFDANSESGRREVKRQRFWREDGKGGWFLVNAAGKKVAR